MQAASPFFAMCIPSTASGFFAMEWNLQGPCFSVNSACATGNHALGVAASLIRMGMADAMFTGGSEAVINPTGLAAFGNIMALSERNDSPQTASRPFDKDRDGFVLSEGAGVLCLEELEHAKRRGATIYAELTGYGFTSDAYDLVAPHPDVTRLGPGHAGRAGRGTPERGPDRPGQLPRRLDVAGRPRGEQGNQTWCSRTWPRRCRLTARSP